MIIKIKIKTIIKTIIIKIIMMMQKVTKMLKIKKMPLNDAN